MVHRRSKREGGFTLLELMIVVLVLGIIVAIAVPIFLGSQSESKKRTCFSNQRAVYSAINAYISANRSDNITCTANVASPDAMGTYVTPALVPTYLSRNPKCPEAVTGDDYYVYRKNGKITFAGDKAYASAPANTWWRTGHQLEQ